MTRSSKGSLPASPCSYAAGWAAALLGACTWCARQARGWSCDGYPSCGNLRGMCWCNPTCKDVGLFGCGWFVIGLTCWLCGSMWWYLAGLHPFQPYHRWACEDMPWIEQGSELMLRGWQKAIPSPACWSFHHQHTSTWEAPGVTGSGVVTSWQNVDNC